MVSTHMFGGRPYLQILNAVSEVFCKRHCWQFFNFLWQQSFTYVLYETECFDFVIDVERGCWWTVCPLSGSTGASWHWHPSLSTLIPWKPDWRIINIMQYRSKVYSWVKKTLIRLHVAHRSGKQMSISALDIPILLFTEENSTAFKSMIPCFVFRCSCSCTVAEKSTGRGWLWLLLISVATQNVPPLHNEASGVTKLLNGGGIHRHIGNTCARITQTGLSPQIFLTWFLWIVCQELNSVSERLISCWSFLIDIVLEKIFLPDIQNTGLVDS